MLGNQLDFESRYFQTFEAAAPIVHLRPALTRQKQRRRHGMQHSTATGLLQSLLILGVAGTAFGQTWYQGIVTNYGSAHDKMNPWQGSYGTSDVRRRPTRISQTES